MGHYPGGPKSQWVITPPESRRSEEPMGHSLLRAILFNNVSRVNVVEQIPTAFFSTTFSNNIDYR